MEISKIKRGNLLSLLWQEMFEKKLILYRRAANYQTMGFLGQHHNPLRQAKNKVMKEKGITGKQYRKLIKTNRREHGNQNQQVSGSSDRAL